MGNQQGSATKATEANQRSNTSASRQPMSPSSALGHPLLQLQQVIGNQAVGRIIQTRLNVSQPGDQYEHEADQMAEMVMRMPDGEAPGISRSSTQIQRQCSDCASGGGICPKCAQEENLQRKPLAETIAPRIQRRCNECEEEEKTLQFKQLPGHTPEITPTIAANIDSLRGGGQPLPLSARSFFEPRFGYDFGDVRVHTNGRAAETAQQVSAQAFTVGRDIVFGAGHYNPETKPGRQLLAHELTHVVQQTPLLSRKSLVIQRQLEDGGPAPATTESSPETPTPTEEVTPTPAETTEETAEARETSTPGLIVEDSADELAAGQMKKSEFLAELRTNVCSAAEEVLSSTGQTTEGCPYLDYWFDFLGNKDSQYIERGIRRYARDASSAATARDYIPIITARVRRGVETWARTGELSEIPEGVPTELPGAGSVETAAGTGPPTGSVQFKSRSGGPREAGSPQAIQAQLGRGRSLDGSVRSRMESAFGVSFSHVRVHNDAGAAQLSNRYHARAFTVGEHVAFGSGEYQPGTPVGDAIIAHELAHVVQQGGSDSSLAPMTVGDTGNNALEEDADLSAVGAVASLWTGAKGKLKDIAHNTMPQLRSGLRLSRCEASKGEGKQTVKKTELGAPTAGECGEYSWKVRFSVENADATTKGYIVQKVDAKYNRTDCADKDKPVTGVGTFPFWEAWGVRGGKVFIGDTADAHNADTYSDNTMGDGTKGSIVVKGIPEFFPNVTLPAHMKANNPDTQAGSLRSSITDPALTGGTGSISHDLTASWNCCPESKDKKTTFSDKK